MAYIGIKPAESFTSFATQTFSTSATSSYTLDHAVTNENELALFINNVRQQPGSGKAYTATGTALTLSANTASTDTMYAVFLGRALQTVNPAGGSVGSSQIAAEMITGQTALAAEPADTDEFLISDAGTLKRIDYSYIKGGGITVADQWRLNTNLTPSGTSLEVITANLEQVDTSGQGTLGSAMTQSSGVFTFPSTGIWLVRASIQYQNDGTTTRYCQNYIQVTTNNSDFTTVTETTVNISSGSGSTYQQNPAQTLIDVTDTSNVKVKFAFAVASTGGSMKLYASSTTNRTYFTFIRLGDT